MRPKKSDEHFSKRAGIFLNPIYFGLKQISVQLVDALNKNQFRFLG